MSEWSHCLKNGDFIDLDGDDIEALAGLSVQRDRAFRALVRNMKTVEDNDFEVPPGLEPGKTAAA